MFQLDWANKGSWQKEKQSVQVVKSNLKPNMVRTTLLLHWEEHCLECAIPHCYEQCPLYEERADKKCRNFVYGIYPNKDFHGLFGFGADIRFRRWGKLETEVYAQQLTVFQHHVLQGTNSLITGIVNLVADIIQPVNPSRRLNSAWAYFREKFFEKTQTISSQNKDAPDDFVLEVFLPEGEKPFRLILEYCLHKETKLRKAFDINPGQNFYVLPAEEFNIAPQPPTGRITIYPENGAGPRVIFTWIDFVKYAPVHKPSIQQKKTNIARPASKVKCVAWDLDNTLWDGILLEDGMSGVRLRPEALVLIKELNERGIIQTVVSKNTFSEAWAIVEKLELQDYFLYPAVNWEPKSGNLKHIAKQLNINLDTFAMIDDSPFEREEVKSVLPQVRVYSEEQIPELLNYSEFDVPITEASKGRRTSYLTEVKRQKAEEFFSGDYESFLRSCCMQLHIFVPKEERHISRCLELIQRSNQLNLSAKKYTEEQFRQLLSDKEMLSLALGCKDRFGDYGVVGFASIDEKKEIPVLQDFVISCRVAQKRVEQTFLKWLANREVNNKRNALRVIFTKTKLNGPLLKPFEEIPFKLINNEGNRMLMELPLCRVEDTNDIMSLEVDVPNSADN